MKDHPPLYRSTYICYFPFHLVYSLDFLTKNSSKFCLPGTVPAPSGVIS